LNTLDGGILLLSTDTVGNRVETEQIFSQLPEADSVSRLNQREI
jgi:hypothetical protein